MLSQLEKAIKLAKKTGDRLIIFDSLDTDSATVLLSLDQYEKLAAKDVQVSDLTDDRMLDRINRDIAVAKNEHIFNFNREEKSEPDDFSPPSEAGAEEKPLKRAGKHWTIPEQVKEGAEEIIEEDRQYLEEVPF
jgi:hypothetical protein